jgi:L-ascorbate metabolism protein UlaG (beta-lactamase superfamily)
MIESLQPEEKQAIGHCGYNVSMRLLTGLLLLTAAALCAQPQRPVDEFSTAAGRVVITPVRHASFMIEANGKVIQVDPWSQGDYEGLPKADLILITDIHPDHLDPKQIESLKKPDTVVIAPAAVAKSVSEAKVIANGQQTSWGDWTIEAVPMYNLKRGPSAGKLYHDKGRGNGYVLTHGGKRFYIAGDTEGTPEMRALKNIDVAFIPMNLPYTMTPQEAADAVKDFHPKVVYPYHYRDSDTKAFAAALAGTGIDVRLRNWYY